MSLTPLLSAYLLGGITFLPLLFIAIVTTAWFTFPQVQDDVGNAKDDDSEKKSKSKVKDAGQEDDFSPEGAANATFAVLRSYNFQSALSTLNARTNIASHGGTDGPADNGGQESMSVYQSMYRSVFERNRNAQKNPLADTDEPSSGIQTRAKPAAPTGSMYHIVLRHGHLMLYDSPAEVEVRHVISMAHHTVLLSDGDGDDENMLESDLFIKRTAIVLKPLPSAVNGDTSRGAPSQPKPFYLFSSNCSEKEDFYHALVASQNGSPVPQPLDPSCSIKLQSSIHSNSLTPESRALNALTNRIFLALHRTPFLEKLVREKIEKKISRVAKPAFISYVNVQSIELGDAGPIFSNLRLKDIHISGDMTLAMDVKYTGGVKVVISAVAKLDLGQRFKVRTVDLVLAGILQRLQGRMLVRVKPPPSNRLWFSFESMPDMDIKVEPIVSSRQITYNWILRQIENRIREVFAETLVKPNWDDAPFFDTLGQTYRGGIWQQEPGAPTEQETERNEPTAKDTLSAKSDKTMSMPNLPKASNSSATSSGVQTPVGAEHNVSAPEMIPGLKQRSVTSLPSEAAQLAAERATSAPRTVRSPSFTSASPSAPSVAVDGSNVDAVRGGEAPQPAKRWIGRSASSVNKRDAVDAVREVKDRSTRKEDNAAPTSPKFDASTTIAEGGDEDDPALLTKQPGELDAERRGSTGSKSSGSLHPNTSDTALHLPRTPSRESLPRTDTMSSTRSSEASQPRGKALLAATAAATSAARQWTMNAVANRNKGSPLFRPPSSHKPGPQEPVGRGQPLPPIGQPLPGPKTSLWGGSAFAGGSVKRKPVLPARKSVSEQTSATASEADTTASIDSSAAGMESSEDVSGPAAKPALKSEEDEFGPWRENFGEETPEAEGTDFTQEMKPNPRINTGEGEDSTVAAGETPGALPSSKKEAPPPLPARRKQAPELPRRPHERENRRDEELKQTAIPSEQDDSASLSSQTSHKQPIQAAQPAAPAPVLDPEAERRGTLELEENDGVHVISAPVEEDEGLERPAIASAEDKVERGGLAQ